MPTDDPTPPQPPTPPARSPEEESAALSACWELLKAAGFASHGRKSRRRSDDLRPPFRPPGASDSPPDR